MKKPTVGLYMIVKDEVMSVTELVAQAKDYFDGIYLTVSDKKAAKDLEKALNGTAEVVYREWNNRFDDARNFNWAQGSTDFGFWLDADDEFDFRVMPALMKKIQQDDIDVIWLPYEYAYDENGNVVAEHWRERLVNRHKGFEWRGWVHENMLSEETYKSERVNMPVKHRRTNQDESQERNIKILEEAYRETNDPRYIHYLGLAYFGLGQHEKSIEILKEYVTVGGWDEEIYRSLLRMADSSSLLGKHEDALQYSLRASAMLPEYPDAYFSLAQFEYGQGNYKETLEWLKVAFSKTRPETASVTDPTIPDRARFIGAMCEYELGNFRDAAEMLKMVKTIPVDEILPEFEHQASVDRLAQILPALKKHYQTPRELWDGLDPELKYDNRFRKFRESVTEPHTWNDNSIVIFCGRGYEEWGPHTLDKGMGGSEEAVVYLSRELAKQGYDVTVFGEVYGPFLNDGVEWLPWQQVDKRDTFANLIIWRYPQFVNQFKAKKKFVDMHDLLPEKVLVPYKDVTYLFKSQFHRDRYPKVTDCKVISNGIVPDHFKPVAKKPNTVGYFSAYYRGLECLIDVWPQIRKEVPTAKLDIYYGWESWVSAEGEDAFYHRMTEKILALKGQGVKEHGRVSHEKLAEVMGKTKVWCYPTQFEEINCITALKANASAMKPVITDVAALKETGGPQATFIETDRIYTDEYNKKKLVAEVVKALKEDQTEDASQEQRDWAKEFSWGKIAKQWKEAIDG